MSEMSSQGAVERLVSQSPQVAALPLIYQRLDEAINDPHSNLSRIADIILEDSSLSARLLRLANSAMYSFPSRVETINRAITIIGTRQLQDLVLATTVVSMFRGVSAEGIDMESFWRHSIAVGICARAIAACRLEANVERFYVLGLLHDIGRLVIYMQLPQQADESIRLSKELRLSLYQAERRLLDFDHTDVGRVLLSSWRLPLSLQEGVGSHHTPGRAGRYPEDAATVHLADIFANALAMGSSGEPVIPVFEAHAWESLGLSEEDLTLIITQSKAQYQDVLDIFLE
ncbi:MAG: HDOD domain-containing protein [Chromatiales bacterium]|nr:HDOD domain-containing protein [Chromatiales bacterium]